MTRDVQSPPDTTPLTEPIDLRQCPTCGSEQTYGDPPVPLLGLVEGIATQRRSCHVCHRPYRVTFRAVRVEAE